MINYVLGLLSYDLGIDLGTANTLVYVEGKGIAIRESTTVARNKKTREIIAVGNAAARMVGKTGKTIEVLRPLKGGVISDFHAASALLTHFIQKVHNSGRIYRRIPRPLVVIGIPTGITEVERKAVIEVAVKAGARKVYLVSEVVAAALGSSPKKGNVQAIIDIGGGTTDIALLVDGREAVSNSTRIAGDFMDRAIADYVKIRFSLLIGQPTAEKTKITLADAQPEREVFHVIRGRDLESGLPRSVRISNKEVHEALAPAFESFVEQTKQVFEEASPELLGEVLSTGVLLSGGGALIRNLDVYLSTQLKVVVRVAEDPLTSVVRGCGKLLQDRALLRKVCYK